MLERELKLHVPAGSRAALDSELRQMGASEILLRAQYFDTQDSDLAKAGIALRLRLEGKQWVQTAKAPGPDELTRLELNHTHTNTDPKLDLALYQDTPLEPFFAQLDKPLLLRYETIVSRLVLHHDVGNSQIEFAFDQGMVKSGALELPLCELEFEQISGEAGDLFTLARQWMQRYGLIIDLRSKAERGSILTHIALSAKLHDIQNEGKPPQAEPDFRPLLKPHHAQATILSNAMSPRQAYQHCVNECLSQIIRNATLLSGVESAGTDRDWSAEYVHQLRVGIRRLRACRRLFKKWAGPVDSTCDTALRQYFTLFGSAHDMRKLAASTEFQSCLLGLLAEQLDQLSR